MRGRLELSPRLEMTASLVPSGARLADVGTDHAYLPAALLLEGRIPSAIASDLRRGPLERARETAAAFDLKEKISFRLCDGLSGVGPEEVDAIVFAGMGGETIAAILAAAPWTRERVVSLILQPMSSMSDLRAWLGQNGYDILEERLAREGDSLYTALSVRAGEMAPMTAAERYAGRNTGDPLRGMWLDRWLTRTERALDGLARARRERDGLRRQELEQVRAGLMEMREEWQNWQR